MRVRRLSRIAGGLVLLGVLVALVTWSARRAPGPIIERPRRHRLAPGLELLEATVRDGGLSRGRLVVLYVDPERLRPRLHLNPELEELRRFAVGAVAAVNAGYFTPEHRPTGLLLSGGQILHPFVRQAGGAGSGVLVVRGGDIRLLERDAVKAKSLEGADLAIQAGPRVIEPDGSPGIRSNDGMRANRTAAGRDGQGRLALAVLHAPDGGVGIGVTLFELQQILGPEGLGAIAPHLAWTAALNLDGGPSTGLHLRAGDTRIDLPALTRVVSVLTLEPMAP